MELHEVKDTIKISGDTFLNSFLKNGWIIVNTRNDDGEDYYILGRRDAKECPIPRDYEKLMQMMVDTTRRKPKP